MRWQRRCIHLRLRTRGRRSLVSRITTSSSSAAIGGSPHWRTETMRARGTRAVARAWPARLLMTAPGIPQLFMGQEFLEFKQWSDDPKSTNLIAWSALESGDRSMVDFLRFMQDVIRLRWRQPALRGDSVRVFHVHNANRVIG